MKKQILSVLLAIIMVFSLIQAPMLAVALDCTHTWTEAEEDGQENSTLKTQATCEADAVYYKVCSICKEASNTETWAKADTKLDHSYTGEVKANNNGTHSFKCVNGCDEYGGTVNCSGGTATCTEKAVCSVCEAEYGSANGHSFTTYTSDNNATCLADGTKTAKCENCTATDTVTDAGTKKDHSYTGEVKANNDDTHSFACVNGCEAYGGTVDCSGGTATCTEKAVCSVCKAEYGSANGHSFTTYTSDNNATCLADGTKTAKCENCTATDTVTDEGSKKDHSYTGEVKANNDDTHSFKCVNGCEAYGGTVDCSGGTATCTQKAVCSTCNAEYGNYAAHSFTDYKSDNNATCLADGTKTAKCDYCTETDTVTDEGSKKDHSYTGEVKANNDDTHSFACVNGCNAYGGTVNCSGGTATCTAKAVCSTCNAEYGEANGHSFTNYVSDNNATCLADGTKTAKCDYCTETDTVTDKGSKKEHSYTGEVKANNNGTHSFKCVNGCDEFGGTVNCSGGTATCTDKPVCAICNTEYGKANGHSFTNYISNNNATCLADGTKTAKCNNCTATDTVTDTGSKKDHSYTGEVKANNDGTHSFKCVNGCNEYGATVSCSGGTATCTQKAVCSVCEAEYGDVLGHDFTEKIADKDHLKSEATCTAKAVYFYDCSRCDVKSDKDTFEDGDTLTHVFTKYIPDNNATCETNETETAKCDNCEATDTREIKGSSLGHDVLKHEAKKPTCTDVGWEEYLTCKRNGCTFSTYKEIAPLGHNMIPKEGRAPTCEEVGCEPYEACSRCDYSTYKEIPSLDHEYKLYFADNNATCLKDGTKTAKCERCDETDEQTVVGTKLPHSYTGEAKSNGDGTHSFKCINGCGEYGKTAENCSGGEATCTSGPICTVCKTEYGKANGHTMQKTEAEAATCLSAGNNEYYTCSVCNKVYKDIDGKIETTVEEETLAQLPHSYTGDHKYDEAARKHSQKCVNGCGEYGTPTPCTFDAGKITTQPSCTEKGVKLFTCMFCSGTYTEEVSANGHTMEKTEAKAATCLSVGNNEYYTCSVCNKVYKDIDGKAETTVDAEVLSKKEHSYTGEAKANNDGTHSFKCINGCDNYGGTVDCSGGTATCTAKAVCSTCNAEYGEANGHRYINYVSDNNATCLNDGTKTAKCENCTETDTVTDTGSKKEHSYTGEFKSNGDGTHSQKCVNGCNEYGNKATCAGGEATCTSGPVCTYCNAEYGKANGHTWAEAEKDKNEVSTLKSEATCVDNAVYYKVCSVCGEASTTETWEKSDTATGIHTWAEAEKDKNKISTLKSEATCVDDEVYYKACSVCGEASTAETWTKADTALGHTWAEAEKDKNEVSTLKSEATCVDDEVYYKVCSVCGEASEAETWTKADTALGHDMITVEAKAPTCTESGWEACEVCTREGCELSIYDELSKIPHTYKTVTTKATLKADGKAEEKCSVCGDISKKTTIYRPDEYTLSGTSYTYTGKEIKPSVTVRDRKGNKISSSNYTVKYSSNKNAGKAKVTITFKGNYIGTKTLSFTIKPKQVTGLKATTIKTDSIKLTWSKASGAKYYKVERSTDGKKWTVLTRTSGTSYTAKKLTAGKRYRFRVTALDAEKSVAGKSSSVLKTGTLTKAPSLTLKSTKSKTATVSWKKLTGAEKYVIYKSKDGKKWKKVTSTTKTSYTLTKLTGGEKIYVKVNALNADFKVSAAGTKSVTVKE